MKLDALKNAMDIVKGRKVPPSIIRARKLMEEKEAAVLALTEVAVERGKRAAKAERRADVLEQVAIDTAFLKKDRVALKQRRGKAARKGGRDTKDSGLWDRYETFRAMKRHLDLARKEKRRLTLLQAAKRVIEASKEEISIEPESLVRYYREWIKKRKTE